jgi:thymidylate synthase (FAD)
LTEDSSGLHYATLDWITPDAEQVVARHARVSTADPDRKEFTKLIKYCIRHGHYSVFEQANASFEIITSRAISTQILRHRSLCFQELSQRYSDPTDVLETLNRQAWRFSLRLQDPKDRQNSIDELHPDIVSSLRVRLGTLYGQAEGLYKEMLAAGVAKECARNILPMCTATRLHANGSLRSWIFYIGLRGAHGTQAEHKIIAQDIRKLLEQQIPTITQALTEYVDEVRPPNMDGWLSNNL